MSGLKPSGSQRVRVRATSRCTCGGLCKPNQCTDRLQPIKSSLTEDPVPSAPASIGGHPASSQSHHRQSQQYSASSESDASAPRKRKRAVGAHPAPVPSPNPVARDSLDGFSESQSVMPRKRVRGKTNRSQTQEEEEPLVPQERAIDDEGDKENQSAPTAAGHSIDHQHIIGDDDEIKEEESDVPETVDPPVCTPGVRQPSRPSSTSVLPLLPAAERSIDLLCTSPQSNSNDQQDIAAEDLVPSLLNRPKSHAAASSSASAPFLSAMANVNASASASGSPSRAFASSSDSPSAAESKHIRGPCSDDCDSFCNTDTDVEDSNPPNDEARPAVPDCEECIVQSASLFCGACVTNLCEGCSALIHRRSLSSHRPQPIHVAEATALRGNLSASVACSHPLSLLTKWCSDCKSRVCETCYDNSTTHSSHIVTALSESSDEAQLAVQDALNTCQLLARSLDTRHEIHARALKILIDEQQLAVKEISRVFTALSDHLMKTKAECIQHVLRLAQEKHLAVSSRESELQQIGELLASVSEQAVEQGDYGRHYALLHADTLMTTVSDARTAVITATSAPWISTRLPIHLAEPSEAVHRAIDELSSSLINSSCSPSLAAPSSSSSRPRPPSNAGVASSSSSSSSSRPSRAHKQGDGVAITNSGHESGGVSGSAVSRPSSAMSRRSTEDSDPETHNEGDAKERGPFPDASEVKSDRVRVRVKDPAGRIAHFQLKRSVPFSKVRERLFTLWHPPRNSIKPFLHLSLRGRSLHDSDTPNTLSMTNDEEVEAVWGSGSDQPAIV